MNRRTMIKSAALGATGTLLTGEAQAEQQPVPPTEVINPKKPNTLYNSREVVPLVVANNRESDGTVIPFVVGNDRDRQGVLRSRLDVATHATKQTWSYKLVPFSLLTVEKDNGMSTISELGVEGWEAVGMIPGGLLFKLPFDGRNG